MDMSNIIQSSMDATFPSGSIVTSPNSSSETYIIKPEDQIGVPVTATTNESGTTSIQLPNTSTYKEQSLILPPNFNTAGGPLLCQLDDNSYVLIEGLDQLSTNATTTNTNTTTTTSTSPTKTSPLATAKQMLNPYTITLKPSTSTTGVSQVKTPTFTTTINKHVTQGLSPPKLLPIGSSNLVKPPTSQGTTRSSFLVMSNQPLTNKDSTSKSFSGINTSLNSSSKTYSNIMTSSLPGQNSNTPMKYILVPQSKANSNSSIPVRQPITLNNALNSGMKTITLNTASGMGFNSTTLKLPAGTSLVPTNFTTKPTIVKPGISSIIPPSKINLKVPPIHSMGKVQSPQIGSTKPSEPLSVINLFEDLPTTSTEDQEPTKSPPKSPTLFDMTVDDIHEISPPNRTKSIITYSKMSPKIPEKLTSPTNLITSIASQSNTRTVAPISSTSTVSAINTKPSSQPTVASSSSVLPLQFIVPTSSSIAKPAPSVSANRKRKCEAKTSMLDSKKVRSEQTNEPDASNKIPLIGELETTSGDNVVREVIAQRSIQPTDKAIINTAVHELKKLVARRELVLKQLSSSCLAMGKIEYKLTISGSPVDVAKIYQRLSSFQEQYENDLKHLDWAVSAMHKLYSELSPKEETRTTEEILQDLVGPAEGIVDDPAAKYEKFRAPTPKKSRVRSPKKVVKKVAPKNHQEEQKEDTTPVLSPLQERKVPDKPDPSDGKFHCEVCSKIFLRQISLAKHLEFDHPVSLELEKKLTIPRSPKLPNACQDCNKSFHSSVMLSIHRANEHDGMDSYEISRESKNISNKRSKNDSQLFSDEDWKSPSEDESKPNKNTKKPAVPMSTRNAKPVRRVKKPAKRARSTANNNKPKTKPIDSLDFLYDSEATITSSPKHNLRSNWRETDLFDPDVPIECTDDNPIIPLKALTPETISAYTGGRY